MLDEVDKLGRDFRGDPASALLEVLDPEQNSTFRDNYLDVPFDLSKVLFITTANVLDPIPDALRDRMEIIPLEGYTEQEKVIIAFRYLIPRQITENGLDAGEDIEFTDDAVRYIVRRYTREAGVRNLEREIGTICRKQARRIAEGTREKVVVTPEVVEKDPRRAALPHRYRSRRSHQPPRRGRRSRLDARGRRRPLHRSGPHARWQQGPHHDRTTRPRHAGIGAGGAHLGARQRHQVRHRPRPVQDQRHPHPRARGRDPQGRPTAGITMATALLSMLTDRRVRRNLAMTGEITLTGQVLPIGGIKEKVLAAKRSGVREVILPSGERSQRDARI